MRLLAGILLTLLFLMACRQSHAQGGGPLLVDLPGGLVTIKDVLTAIENATGLGVYYLRGTLDPDKQVTTKREKLPFRSILDHLLDGNGLYYDLEGPNIFIRRSVERPVRYFTVIVTDEDGQQLPGAALQFQSSGKGSMTGADGIAILHTWKFPDTLLCYAVGRHPVVIPLTKDAVIRIKMLPRLTVLTEMMVRVEPMRFSSISDPGEYSRNKDLLTRKLTSIDRQQLSEMPGSNLLTAMTGRISGLLVTQRSGIHGSSVDVSIRGGNSILNGKSPLFIIDGVPFAPGNQSVSKIPGGNAAGSLNPFSFMGLDNIENISVLKDADAAIYGSRGANGVVLIRTRQATRGKTSWNFIASTGFSQVTHRPTLMDTRQYMAMRKEALQNDGLMPDAANAPELIKWDTTRNQDYVEYLIGRSGHMLNLGTSVTGGSASKNYFLGFDHYRETDVFPTHPIHSLYTANGNFNYRSANERLSVQVKGLYGRDDNNQFIIDPTSLQFFMPNAPDLRSEDGNLVFSSNGISINNPLTYISYSYSAHSYTLLAGVNIDYRLTDHLIARHSYGYNEVEVGEYSMKPAKAQDPSTNASDSANFATSSYTSWISRSMLEYRQKIKDWQMTFLAGISAEERHSSVNTISAEGDYGRLTMNRVYKSFFTSLRLGWKEKYQLDLTGRRDGSAAFVGAGQYGNFGSASLAWIFSKEPFFQHLLPFVDLARIRTSYGLTGNDQITNNEHTDIPIPWEKVLRREIALEAGMPNDRLTFSVIRYHNHSLNQLLPAASNPLVFQSLPVIVQNSGWEFSLSSGIIGKKGFKWSVALNLSIPVNKLAAFPGIETTPFKKLMVGKSLTSVAGYRYTGVDPTTGLFQFKDFNGDGRLTDADKEIVGNLDPVIFGGLTNSFSWGHWRLSVHVEARIQQGFDYQTAAYTINPPGSSRAGVYSNQTKDMNNYWRRPGDKATYQRLTTKKNSPAGEAIGNYIASSAVLTDASFARLKSIYLSYQLPASKKIKLQECKFFLQAENLFTLTPYRDGDPEIPSRLILPPSRTISAGIQLKF